MTNSRSRAALGVRLIQVALLGVLLLTLNSSSAAAKPVLRPVHSAKYLPPVPGLPAEAYIASLFREFQPPAHRYGPGHRGVDSPMTTGSGVAAPASGVVSFAGNVAGRPLEVILHDDGLRSTLEPVVPEVKAGDRVMTGAQVGVLDKTQAHCDSQRCLHWGVRLPNDSYLNPLSLLVRVQIVLLPLEP